MASVRACTVAHVGPTGFALRCGAGEGDSAAPDAYSCFVSAVDAHVVRVCFAGGAPASATPPPRRTCAVLPPPPDAPPCAVRVDVAPDGLSVTLRTPALAVCATLAPSLSLAWSRADDGSTFAQDRLCRAYALSRAPGALPGVCAHAARRGADDAFYGLGDRTGPLNLSGRRLRTHMADALGRDPECVAPQRGGSHFSRGDPGYKHWPFLLVRTRGGAAFSGCSPPGEQSAAGGHWTCYGVLYDTPSASTFDLGCEHSNYHGAYRSFEAAGGARELDFYTILGPSLPDVTRRFVRLTGRAPLPPRWTLGYGMTAMPLADAPDAAARIGAFCALAAAEGVAASSFHFGSGYTLIDGKRCVFTWNRSKFPDPDGLIATLHALGLFVVANVKPCLLDAHPEYAAVAGAGLCVRASASGSAAPARSQFWDGEGAHLDFGNPDAAAWWRAGLARALLSRGVDAIWNDNNEYEIDEEGAACFDASGTQLVPFHSERGLQPLHMCAASIAATRAAAPARRPFGISRAMSPGCQRLCSTWSGDNDTSWRSLRWGMRTGLQMALSGMYFFGHDVGGFAGPVPDAELLVRWYQAGLLHTRFVSNSWKACGTVTCPWMHPGEPAAACRAAIALRYALMPYLYTLARAATDARDAPPLRPVFWDFGEADAATWQECDEAMLGPALLAAPVVHPGHTQRTAYLPAGPACWYCFHTGAILPAGAAATVAAPLDRLPLFCPAGAMLPMADLGDGDAWRGAPHDAPSRLLRVFPAPSGEFEAELFEDDGLSVDDGDGASFVTLRFRMRCSAEQVCVSVAVAARAGAFALPYDSVAVALPVGETRQLLLLSEDAGGAAPRLIAAPVSA